MMPRAGETETEDGGLALFSLSRARARLPRLFLQ
jgi:hypothetical protein